MNLERIKYLFNKLPFQSKLILLGSSCLFVSGFLPWYSDIDSYNTGDLFLGISGPTSFIGIAIIVCAGGSFFLALQRARGRSFPKFNVRDGFIHLLIASEAALLLFLVNSVFYHPRFGVHITLKEPKFGMVLAGLSVIAFLAGSYLLFKEEGTTRDEIGKLEPLIKIDDIQKNETPALESKLPRQHQPLEEDKKITPVVRGSQLEGFTYRRDPTKDALRKKIEQHDEIKRVAPQKWRTDL